MGRILKLTERTELAEIESLRGGDFLEFNDGNFELVLNCDSDGIQTIGILADERSYLRTREIEGWDKKARKFMGFKVYDEFAAKAIYDYINELMERALSEAG